MIRKNYLRLIFSSLLLTLTMTVTSCGDDESDSPLVGTWEGDGMVYCFNSDGTGWWDYSEDNGASEFSRGKSNFTWTTNEIQIFVRYDGSGNSHAGNSMSYYEVDGNRLTLYYEDGEYRGTYYRK